MAHDDSRPSGFSLRRWSARKHEVAREGRRASSTDAPKDDVLPESPLSREVEGRASELTVKAPALDGRGRLPISSANAAEAEWRPSSAEHGVEERGAKATAATESPAVPLPAIDALSIDSDYSPFMQSGVNESLRRGALKKLFSDPRFNIMDGLDVYIDDYSKPDPIDPAIVRTLVQARYIFNPPTTRVNAQGYVEDVQEDAALREGEPEDAQAQRAEPQEADARSAEAEDAEVCSGEQADAEAQTAEPEDAQVGSHEPAGHVGTDEPADADVGTREPVDAGPHQGVPEEATGVPPSSIHHAL